MTHTLSEYQIAGLNLPHASPNDRLRRIFTAALPNQGSATVSLNFPYWDAEFFNLDRVKIFKEASDNEQSVIVQLANHSLLEEAYYIEKAGVGYMAKMVLLAETVEERMLYGLFAADEATHLSQISCFLPEISIIGNHDPFLSLLAEVVESTDKTVLLFVLQVVLEGWGLTHYRRLAKECRDRVLAEVFSSFLDAEARHHATGSLLFEEISLSKLSQALIIELLAKFLMMVQVGPQNVLAAIAQVKGDLSRSQKIQILEELDTETHSGKRLQLLRSLMRGKSADAIVQALEERGAFVPLPAHHCVNPIQTFDMENPLSDYPTIYRKLQINYKRNKQQDHTALMEEAVEKFCYEDCKNEYWNPEEFSLLYGTPLWDQSSQHQRVILNQLYWVAYYSQIVSAEIATIFFNQTSATGLYAHEDFRLICDTLDLESSQERAHIYAFRTIAKQVEQALFGELIFTYPMRNPFTETMVYADTNQLKSWWKKIQLQYFGVISANNTFLACQYFTVRGVRTLNGKLIQHKLSNYYQKHPHQDLAPIPAKISYYHFLDESFHFNSSTIVSHDVVNCLAPPTAFEGLVANLGLWGCQRDHFHFSAAINGIFWYDPALYGQIYRVLRSPLFDLTDKDAKNMMRRCFTEESEGLHRSYLTHQEAMESYKVYVEKLDYLWKRNQEMSLMASNSIPQYLATQQSAFKRFEQ